MYDRTGSEHEMYPYKNQPFPTFRPEFRPFVDALVSISIHTKSLGVLILIKKNPIASATSSVQHLDKTEMKTEMDMVGWILR